MSIVEAVKGLAVNPFSAWLNFYCAVEYEKEGQIFSAITFYLRAAEFGRTDDGYDEEKLIYNSLLKVARCLEPQRERDYSVTNCLLQAITVCPERPEAYWMLSQYHERLGNWQESYTYAVMGLVFWWDQDFLEADVGYEGEYCLEFQKAVAAYWIGRRDESIQLLRQLQQSIVSETYATAVKNNLERIANA